VFLCKFDAKIYVALKFANISAFLAAVEIKTPAVLRAEARTKAAEEHAKAMTEAAAVARAAEALATARAEAAAKEAQQKSIAEQLRTMSEGFKQQIAALSGKLEAASSSPSTASSSSSPPQPPPSPSSSASSAAPTSTTFSAARQSTPERAQMRAWMIFRQEARAAGLPATAEDFAEYQRVLRVGQVPLTPPTPPPAAAPTGRFAPAPGPAFSPPPAMAFPGAPFPAPSPPVQPWPWPVAQSGADAGGQHAAAAVRNLLKLLGNNQF